MLMSAIGLNIYCTEKLGDIGVVARKAEELGFDSIWVPDHPVTPVIHSTKYPSTGGDIPPNDTYIVNPLIALARASATTTTIKLGTGICLATEHNPLNLSKELATLDVYSGGRFLSGVGAGWFREQIEVMGGNFEHRWSQAREAVLAMKEVWANDEAEFHGKYYDFPPILSYPKPVQRPHPPIFLAGDGPRMFPRIVSWGDGWLPDRIPGTMDPVGPDLIKQGRQTLDQLASDAGRDPKSIQITVFGKPPDRDFIDRYFEAGADRVLVGLKPRDGESPLDRLERIAQMVLR